MSESSVYQKGSFLVVPNKQIVMKLRGAPLNVFLSIVDHANADGECWPSYNTISDDVGYGRREVIRAVDDLIELGLIVKRPQTRDNGSSTSNVFTVMTLTPPSSGAQPIPLSGTQPTPMNISIRNSPIENTVLTEQGQAHQEPEYGNTDINQVITHFESKMGKMARMQYQRRAAHTLLARHGLDRVIGAINAVEACRDQHYAPSISSLEVLRDRWIDLENFYRRKSSNTNSKLARV